jgi:hypothetical protein
MNENERATVKTSPSAPEIFTPVSLLSSDSSQILMSSSPRPVASSAKGYRSVQSTASSEISKPKFLHLIKWRSKSRSSKSTPVAGGQPCETGQSQPSDAMSLPGVSNRDQGSINSKQSDVLVAASSARMSICGVSGAQEEPQLSANSPEAVSEHENEGRALPKNVTKVNQPANTQRKKQLVNVELLVKSKILDLCTTIQHSKANTYLDHPMDIRKEYLRFSLGTKMIRQKEGSISLQELLEGNPHHFPPAKRVMVATILASSLLQLQRTQWIKDDWSKRDIFFRTRDDAVIFEQLYLLTEFASSIVALATDNSEKEGAYSVETDLTSSIASTIAGRTLTVTTSNMTKSLSSVQPFHLKKSLQCLGIVLIELCFGEPIERNQNKVTVRPQEPINNETNHDFCLAIANKWTWQEISAWDPSFSDPIDMCLRFPNLGRAKQGRYDEIVQEIYSGIVKPLQDEMNRRWQPALDQTICV